MLVIFPGFKSAFSNVVGYFAVAGQANNILTELLVDTEINKKIQDDTTITEEKKKSVQSAADAILKLCGNMSILINKIVPENFSEYWKMLTPLMKDKYQNLESSTMELKQKLLDIVVLRDNIGEALWYVYTAVLLTSVIQYNLANRTCNVDLNTIEENRQNFLKQQSDIQTANTNAQSTVYTINN